MTFSHALSRREEEEGESSRSYLDESSTDGSRSIIPRACRLIFGLKADDDRDMNARYGTVKLENRKMKLKEKSITYSNEE